ncbi:MAG: family 43 glycosylhydrolase [Verrucomicrobiales bacterium]|nr:family 43 glycosylhydrolase [Verrucomicrobiales bacterium]
MKPRVILAPSVVTVVTFAASVVSVSSVLAADPPSPHDQLSFHYAPLKGLGPERGVTRRDPSDVIRWRDRYYVWYTKTDLSRSGYNATVWCAVSEDGESWREAGESLARGPKGAWDSYSVFTPNILEACGRFYLFYTAVKPTPGNPDEIFENNNTTDITAIGVAVADSPDGLFQRVGPKPVLGISESSDAFDSYRVDDACLLLRDGRYWLYYKGRSRAHGAQGPSQTRMGVAFADHPEGPYRKYAGNPVTRGGHEVLVWPFKEGVMTLLSAAGQEGRTLQYAPDGLAFSIVGRFGNDYPKAPGAYRPDAFIDTGKPGQGIHWGISMNHGGGDVWPYLLRYEIEVGPNEGGG